MVSKKFWVSLEDFTVRHWAAFFALTLLFVPAWVPKSNAATVPLYSHVVIVMGENTDAVDALPGGMPWLNSIATQYAQADQFYAITHPSIGNYFSFTTGSILTNDDAKDPSNFPVSTDNVVRELVAAGRTWKSYAEDLPSVGYTGGDNGNYAVRHNPFPYFTDVQNSATQVKNVVPFTQFATDLAANNLPNYSFVVPNLCNDAHDCSIQTFDNWMKSNIGPLLSNSQLMQSTLLIITFDEAGSDGAHGGGRIAYVMAGPNVKTGGFHGTGFYQNPALVRLSLEALGVNAWPNSAASAPSMAEFFTTSGGGGGGGGGGGTIPPTVSISAPTNGQTVAGSVNVLANASDNVGVTKVEFYVDNALATTDTASPYSFTWNTTGVADGSHTLMAKAYNAAGNSSSASVTVTVNNNAPPPPPPPPPPPTSITISVSPSSASLQASQSQQFSAQVSGSTNTAVTWSVSGAGTISSNGLYIAPSSISSQTTVTIRATSQANTSVSATATIALLPPSGGGGGTSLSGGPVIFYSDLTSGPNTGGESGNGAFVTIYGKGFGFSQGNSTVLVGGGAATNYKMWTDTKIAFQLGANANSGNITVTTSKGTSNGVPFTVRPGNIYFASPSGSDSNNGSSGSPFGTLSKCKNTLAPGDICYAMDGLVQAGNDGYGGALELQAGGTVSAPKALVVYPGATATIGPGSSRGAVHSPEVNGAPWNNWVIAGFTMVTNRDAMDINITDGWRVVGNIMTCPNGDGMAACVETSQTTNMKFLGNHVYNVSTNVASPSKKYHGVYFSSDSNHIEAAWNLIENVNACRGLQFHSSPLGGNTGFNQYDLSVHDNVIHDTRCDGLNFATIDPSKGKVEAYNNLIYNAGKGPDPLEGGANYACINFAGITNAGSPGSGTANIYNNTLYDCGARGGGDAGAISLNPNIAFTVNLTDNIIGVTGSEVYTSPNSSFSFGSPVTPRLSGSNNLFFGAGNGPNFLSANVNADPKFVSTGSDFHLQTGSPAINAGVTTNAVTDLDGLSRPQGSAYDIGAYEYTSGGTGGGGGGGGGDTIPPTVSLTAPQNNATVSGTVTVSANASDNVGVVGVQFKLDGQNLGAEDTSAPYSVLWNTTQTTNGPHNLVAFARDAAGNMGVSNIIFVTVSNQGPPPPPPPPPPPGPSGLSITNVGVSRITSDSATISWSTNLPANSTVIYGPDTTYGLQSPSNILLVTAHTIALTGLAPATTYHYEVISADTNNNVVTSADQNFTTLSASPPQGGNNKFVIGDRVKTTERLRVRPTPSTKPGTIKIEKKGALGTVVDGPRQGSHKTWWKIQYDDGATGWSTESHLTNVGGVPPPPSGGGGQGPGSGTGSSGGGQNSSGGATGLVNTATGFEDSGTYVTSISANAQSYSQGNLLYVACAEAWDASSMVTVSDSAGNSFAPITIARNTDVGMMIQNFYAKNIAASPSDIVTCTFSKRVNYVHVHVLQYAGLDPNAPLDTQAASVGSGSSANSSALSPSAPNEVVVASAIAGYGSAKFSGSGGYTVQATTDTVVGTEDQKFTNAQSSVTATMDLGRSTNWGMVAASFHAR